MKIWIHIDFVGFLLELFAILSYCHLKKIGTRVALKISDNIYVDNVLLGANSVQNAYEIYLRV